MTQKSWGLVASLSLCAFAICQSQSGSHLPSDFKVDFNRDVRPILSDHCYRCHGPAVKDVKGDLRLNDSADATRIRRGYYAIRPGHASDSLLVARIDDPGDDPMPPRDSGVQPLSAEQKEILKLWIDQGAVYKPHWAFIAPFKPPLPAVKNGKWVRNDIDRFILARMEKADLGPEAEADRNTLIRRVCLTLTGLPPSPEELAQYLNDKKSGAYQRMVERYLASPRYGENQARYWLDAVRYGDTHGLHLDNERAVYPYRDWVVRAFNEDLPFDKFATWQVAGDMLPNPTTEQKIATGYVRMNPTSNEGGAIEEEFLVRNTMDRVDTFGTVFLGMTVGCAKCHDHKFDPVTMKDYYGMFAFFNSTADKPLDGNELYPMPAIKAMTPEEELRDKKWHAELASIEQKVNLKAAMTWLDATWKQPPTASGWEVSPSFMAKSFDEAFATEFGPEPGGLDDTAQYKPFALEVGKQYDNVGTKENAAVFLRGTIDSSVAQDLELRLASDDGVKVWLNGAKVHENKALRSVVQATDTIKVKLVAGKNPILIEIVNATGPDGVRFDFGDPAMTRLDNLHKLIVKKDPSYVAELRKVYLENGPATPAADAYRKSLANLNRFEMALPMTLVAEELPKSRPTFVLRRGEYTLPTDPVQRQVPVSFGKWPASAPKNRLGLAEWLTQKSNPLVARVFVNRVWQQHFGTGLVKTAEDFGAQGEYPVHPELLDYLATAFMENGWSLKKLHRMILNSAAFKQRSSTTALKREKDPENRLISHGPRFRLDAEVIRDQALAVSGLLVEQIGGKGVKPYQPDGLWEAVAFSESTTAKYMQDKGEPLYRRSLYLFWKRTSPPPAMLTFDSPMRESCVVRRSRTNTPLQALVTMNEPAYFEATRVIGSKLASAATDDKAKLNRIFNLALGRQATDGEQVLLLKSLNKYRSEFTSNPERAKSVLEVGEFPQVKADPVDAASWTMVCSTLLNTDEFLTQH